MVKGLSRAALVSLHRYVGLAIAAFLFVAGLSGSVIVFQQELDAWLNPELFSVARGRSPMPIDRLIQEIERQDPRARVGTVHFPVMPEEPMVLWVEPRTIPGEGDALLGYNQVFVDAGTGQVLGRRDFGALRLDRVHLLPFLYKLHYTLHLPDMWGDWLMGGVAIAWFFDAFVGFWLTLPRGLRSKGLHHAAAKSWWQRWKPAWRIKWGGSPVRFKLDLHRAIGLWLWGVLVTMAMTGVYLSLGTSVFVPVVRLFGPVTPTPYESLPVREPVDEDVNQGWDRAFAAAWSHLPANDEGWRPRWMYRFREQRAFVVDVVEPGHGRRGLRFDELVIDDRLGTLISRRGYERGTAADRFIAWQYPLHSGQVAGLPGRLLICVTGLATAVLSVTGVAIWARKRAGRRAGIRGGTRA